VGVNTDGRRRVLSVTTGASEAEVFWRDFPRSLADRGLRGVKLVIADDHKGLRVAARRVFDAGIQWCRVHWTRNMLAHAAREQHAAMIRTIFAQKTKAEADAQRDKVADTLRDKHAKLGELMDAAREDVLTYLDYPKDPLRGLLAASLTMIGSSASWPLMCPDREHQSTRATQQGDQAESRRGGQLP
jgi:transposase-like protein